MNAQKKEKFGTEYPEFLPSRKACAILGVHSGTLRAWDRDSKIEVMRTIGGKRLYNVKAFLADSYHNSELTDQGTKICYCRVSSPEQQDDMERQIAFMQSKYPEHIIIKDVGSGINWKRKGLITLLQGAFQGRIKEVVVAHRDRLARFGYELLEYIFKYHHIKLVVLDEGEQKSAEQELAEDLLAITHIFSCRQMGKRRYVRKNVSTEIRESDREKGEDKVVSHTKARNITIEKGKASSNTATKNRAKTMDGMRSNDIQQGDSGSESTRSKEGSEESAN